MKRSSCLQEVSGIYTSPFLDTDGLKMALRARKVSGTFEKRAPGVELRTENDLQLNLERLARVFKHVHFVGSWHCFRCVLQRQTVISEFPVVIVVIYQTLRTTFDHISKHRDEI